MQSSIQHHVTDKTTVEEVAIPGYMLYLYKFV